MSEDQKEYIPATIETTPLPTEMSPMNVIMVAIEKGYDPVFIEKMMDLQDRHEKKAARKAFIKAMAAFKNEPIFITKDKENKQYGSRYTSKGNLINTVTPLLGKHGFSHRFEFKNDGAITVTCVLTHEEGHSESVSISGPLDDSGKKNSLQQIKSTKTYLEIATFESVTGIASQDGSADDDGNSAVPVEIISDDMQLTLATIASDAHVDEKKFCQYFGITSFDKLPLNRYGEAVAMIEKKLAQTNATKEAKNADNQGN